MISTVMNVRDYLLAGKDPSRIALRFPHTCHSFGALTAHADYVAAYLLRRGVRKGDRVLLIGDNSFFWVTCYLGIMQAGSVCVPIATSSHSLDIEYVLEMTEAAIVCAQRSVAIAQGARFSGRHLLTDKAVPPVGQTASQQDFSSLDTDTIAAHDYPYVGPNDLAALVFTSGSTGQPRG